MVWLPHATSPLTRTYNVEVNYEYFEVVASAMSNQLAELFGWMLGPVPKHAFNAGFSAHSYQN